MANVEERQNIILHIESLRYDLRRYILAAETALGGGKEARPKAQELIEKGEVLKREIQLYEQKLKALEANTQTVLRKR